MLPDSYTVVHRYDGAIIQRQRSHEPEPCALRQRDLAIVRDVWHYHFLTTNQLRELWWPDRSIQAARRRLVKLFRAGHLERFRPYSPRGSYQWTYFLSPTGHRLLREIGVIDPGARFKPRDIFDYGRARHDIQLNAWVLAYRRLLGDALLEWRGEHQVTPPREARQTQLRLSDEWSVEGLRNPQRSSGRAGRRARNRPRRRRRFALFLIEYDRTSRTDKNYDKFRRYDTFLTAWWRHTEHGQRAEPPFVLFVCRDEAERDDFLARADHELTGHHWHPTHTPEQHKYVGRRHILFCNERDAHLGQPEARRVPPFPPGHRSCRGHDAEIRAVRLPGPVSDIGVGLARPLKGPSSVQEPDARDSNREAASLRRRPKRSPAAIQPRPHATQARPDRVR
jgi:Replication-relaxation